MHAGDELVATDARHPVVERYAADAFVPNDVTLDAAEPSARDPDRPEHGRQVDLPATDGAPLPDGAGRVVRAARTAKLPVVDRLFAASARRTTSPGGSPPSWSRCRRPRTSCTAPPRAASSSSTRSAAAPRPSTASASRGRSPSTWRRTPGPGPRPSSRRTTTS